jgi:hypothetical protein
MPFTVSTELNFEAKIIPGAVFRVGNYCNVNKIGIFFRLFCLKKIWAEIRLIETIIVYFINFRMILNSRNTRKLRFRPERTFPI